MSLFEWLGESFNPGSVGGVTSHDNDRSRTRLGAICTGVVALGLCSLPFFVGVGRNGLSLERVGITLAVESIYIALAYYLKPEPDMENIGWLGGLMDHPFRYSDDVNRFLLFVAVVLFPGRLIGIGLVDFFRAFRQNETEG